LRAISVVVIAAVVAALTVLAPGAADVAEAQGGPEVTEYAQFDATTALSEIVQGPGGRMWATMNTMVGGDPPDLVEPRLASITMSGAITEHPLPYVATHLASDGGDTLWISSGPSIFDQGQYAEWPVITQVSSTGTIVAEHRLPASPFGGTPPSVSSMTVGPDGNIWYTAGRIGRMTPAGVFTESSVPDGSLAWFPRAGGITTGADGALWWTEGNGDHIGRTTTSGETTTFSIPGASRIGSVVSAPDGSMWAVEQQDHLIARVSPTGVVTTEPWPVDWMVPEHLLIGPDGNTWGANLQGIVRISPSGDVTDFPTGDNQALYGVAFGPDGRLWYVRGGSGPQRPALGALGLDPVPTGEFTALTPARILDTRDGTGRGGATTPLGSGGQFDVQITGRGGVPSSGVAAVVLNATVTAPTAPSSWLTVWPAGRPRPEVSNVNYPAGQTVPNLVTVAVGTGGKLSVFNGAGSAHVLFDVLGYYSDASGPFGARFVPTDPVRVLDTRDGTGAPAQPIGPGGSLPFDLTGADLLPETGVSGVVMNVTVTSPTVGGFLTVHPDGVTRPLASNLNFVRGQTVANLVTVRLSGDGLVRFFNSVGTTHVIADLVGFYTDEVTTNAGRFVPVTPLRLVDTRSSGYGPVGPEQAVALRIPEDGHLTTTQISAAAVNITATQPTATGYLTVHPDGCEIPYVSSLNFTPGQTVANHAISAVSARDDVCSYNDRYLNVTNAVGDVHIIADLFGYFTDDTYVDHTPG
jgi:streptogramin lyase